MKKVVIAVDSFKGSISSATVGKVISDELKQRCQGVETLVCPIADGGEGMMDSISTALSGERIELEVMNPLMRPIPSHYFIIEKSTALIEMASSSGLVLIDPSERNPLKTTTRGVGETILHALDKGCRRFIIGIGGSATNDGGMGMLQALGFRFWDKNGDELGVGGEMLIQIDRIDDQKVDRRLKECSFQIACDVTNPLYGRDGAAYIFGPQKGADQKAVELLDRGLRNYAEKIYQYNGKQVASIPGSGAAGGIGGGMAGLLNATLQSGISLVLEALRFEERAKGADCIITGEGKMDRQTLMGKAPWGVLQVGLTLGIPVVGVAGRIDDNDLLIEAGFSRLIEVSPRDLPLAEVMQEEVVIANIRKAMGYL